MYAEPEPQLVVKLPPCSICGDPAPNGFWGERYLCDGCHGRWWTDAPALTALELAHADKHPDDIEAAGEYQFSDASRTSNRWVILKDGVGEKVAGDFAAAWIERQRAQHRRSA